MAKLTEAEKWFIIEQVLREEYDAIHAEAPKDCNRSLTTHTDLADVYGKLFEDGTWPMFFSFAMMEYERVCRNWQEGYDYEYAAWLHCLAKPEHIPERMRMVIEFKKSQ